MVLSNKKLKQKLRAAKAELIAASQAEKNLTDINCESSQNLDPKTLQSLRTVLNLEAKKPRLSKREKRRQTTLIENADVIRNGEMSGDVEPKKQDGPNSDAMLVKKKKKRERYESEASENVKKMPQQLKKKKKRPKKKVENAKVKEEGVGQNVSGATGDLLVIKTDESNERKDMETSLKLYVGGIPYYSTEDDIRSYFEGCGTIACIDCMTFPDTGKFRGIAIITFKTEAAAKRAMALNGSDMGGLSLKIQLYKPARVSKLPSFSPSVSEGYNRIYVGNLSWDITEDYLRKLFADFTVTSIRFGEDKETGEFKGYAHVDFADSVSLNEALKLDQTIVSGRPVRISCAVPKKGTATKLQAMPTDNQVDMGKMGADIRLEATPKDNTVYSGNVGVVAENQVTDSGTNAVNSKIWRRTCYECGERGHLSSSCPKKQAADLTNPKEGTATKLQAMPTDNQISIGKKGTGTKLEAIPQDDKVDRVNVDVVVQNHVTNSGISAVSSKIRRRTCYECGERGHLSSSCPKKQAADTPNPSTA